MRAIVLAVAVIWTSQSFSTERWALGLGGELNFNSTQPESIPKDLFFFGAHGSWLRDKWGVSLSYWSTSERTSVGNYKVENHFQDLGAWGQYNVGAVFFGHFWLGLGVIRRSGSVVTELAGSRSESSINPKYIPGLEWDYQTPLGKNWIISLHSFYLLAKKNPERMVTLGISVQRLWPTFTE